MKSLLALIVLHCISFVVVLAQNSGNELCKPTVGWTADGRDILVESRGRVLFVAFMELHCPYCHLQLNQFKIMSEMLADVKFVVIAPKNESDGYVRKWQNDLNSGDFLVFRETDREPVWRQLSARNHDFFLFDRCGRLAYLISHPQSNTSYHDTLNALHYAVDFAQCGWCQYDPNPRRPSGRPDDRTTGTGPAVVTAIRPPFRVNAYLGGSAPSVAGPGVVDQRNTTDDGDRQGDQRRFETFEYRNQADPGSDGRRNVDGESRNDNRQGQSRYPAPDNRGSNRYPAPDDRGSNRYPAPDNRDSNRYPAPDNRGSSRNPASTFDQRYTVTQQPPPMRNTYQPPANRYDGRAGYDPRTGAAAPTVDPRWQQPDQSSYGDPTLYQVQTAGPSFRGRPSPTPQPTKLAEIYDDEYKYEYDYEHDLKPTDSVQDQIPPTMPPRTMQTPKPFSVDNIPCTAYTDAVCFEQQERNGVGNMHQCCHKRIYLSNVCVADKCGNETYQLCCFQKFIQARYHCCNSELITGERPDEFSRCCYTDFVERDDDDPCCPGEIAGQYWSEKSTLFELCLPNVDADFSKLKLTAKMKDQSTATLDLGENKLWDYQCPNAIKRDDYFFYQPETNVTKP